MWLLDHIEQLLNSSQQQGANTSAQADAEYLFHDSLLNHHTEIFLLTAYAVVGVLGFGSNLIVVVALISAPNLLQQTANVRFLFLMIAGLMMCVFCLPVLSPSVP